VLRCVSAAWSFTLVRSLLHDGQIHLPVSMLLKDGLWQFGQSFLNIENNSVRFSFEDFSLSHYKKGKYAY
jgi:hypothetical protein